MDVKIILRIESDHNTANSNKNYQQNQFDSRLNSLLHSDSVEIKIAIFQNFSYQVKCE